MVNGNVCVSVCVCVCVCALMSPFISLTLEVWSQICAQVPKEGGVSDWVDEFLSTSITGTIQDSVGPSESETFTPAPQGGKTHTPDRACKVWPGRWRTT